MDAGKAKMSSGCGALDFVWDQAESRALRHAGKDAELTASADSVRAYLGGGSACDCGWLINSGGP